MVKKIKRVFIVFMCTILLVTNISFSAIKPLSVKATGAEIVVVGGVAYEGLMLLLDAIAAGLVSIGAYELYENDERFSQVVDTYLGGLTGTWDETVNKWIPQGTEEHYGKTWLHDPSSPESVWEPTGELVSLTEEEAAKLGLSGAQVFSWDEYVSLFNQKAEELARQNHPEWFDDESGGGGDGDNNGDNNEHPTHDWKAMLKDYWNSNSDTIAKIGSGLIISVSSFMDKLTSGETGNETIDAWANEIPEPSYTGTLMQSTDGTYSVNLSGYFEWSNGTKYNDFVAVATGLTGRPFATISSLDGSSLNLYKVDTSTSSGYSSFRVEMTRTYCNGSSIRTFNETLSYIALSGQVNSLINCDFPVFLSSDTVGIQAYVDNGDDSACINKEEPQKLVWADMNTLANSLPTTLSPLAAIPEGQALKATALKDYVDTMTDYKTTATPAQLSDPETQAQTAAQAAQQAAQKNTVDVQTDTQEETAPSFVPPSGTSIDVDGSDATRDWRLVFPFCIPFDLIDLFKVLCAEPKAPYWEIPLKIDMIGYEYTFVIDFEQFETLAQIFRICETIVFILGLVLITGKVIKW